MNRRFSPQGNGAGEGAAPTALKTGKLPPLETRRRWSLALVAGSLAIAGCTDTHVTARAAPSTYLAATGSSAAPGSPIRIGWFDAGASLTTALPAGTLPA